MHEFGVDFLASRLVQIFTLLLAPFRSSQRHNTDKCDESEQNCKAADLKTKPMSRKIVKSKAEGKCSLIKANEEL